jgi:cytochrome c biogenesis protein CcdA
MAVAMYLRDDPQGTLANMLVMLGLALVLTPCALALLRPVLRASGTADAADGARG